MLLLFFRQLLPPPQAHPVVPGFPYAIARREIFLVEFVALDELREDASGREIGGIQNGVGSDDRLAKMRIARRGHRQSATLRVFECVTLVATQRDAVVETYERTDGRG